MRYYNSKHKYHCGVDLHSKAMYLCIVDSMGEIVLHRNFLANPDAFLKAVAPYRESLVVGCECAYSWYWLVDHCQK